MLDAPTTGVPNPDKPGQWLIPPWAPGASFREVVQHFILRHPWLTTNTAHLLAYYEGFRAALDGAPAEEPLNAHERRWQEDMRNCVDRCIRVFQEKRAAVAQEMRPAA